MGRGAKISHRVMGGEKEVVINENMHQVSFMFRIHR